MTEETCQSCGGVIGRDCYNPMECQAISDAMSQDAHAAVYAERDQLKARVAELEIERDGFKAGSADNARHFEVLKADYDALRSLCMEMAEALEACRAQFKFYADEHRAAHKFEKAATNERFRDIAYGALSRAKDAGVQP